jgi:hypothetical protein
MLSTDITGRATSDADGMMALIKLVSEPDAYREKLKVLVEATEENKKFVALVGPADDVLRLREAAVADRALAKEELAAAKSLVTKNKAAAKAQAEKLISDTEKACAEKVSEANAVVAEAKRQLDESSLLREGVTADQKKVVAAQELSAKKEKDLKAAKESLAADKKEIAELRDQLRKKLEQIAKAADL